MINKLNDLPSYETWIRMKMVETVEDGFRDVLNIDNDVPLNYYIDYCCVDSDGKCQRKHRLIWCQGMTTVQFIKKVLNTDNHFALFVTSYDSKGSLKRALELDDWDKKIIWIGDGTKDGMICCDKLWRWLFDHVKEKKAK
jgi:hypothetical protein